MKIISRQEANERGLTRYFTGKPCKHGHIVERTTPNGTCMACQHTTTKKWRKDNPEGNKESYTRYYRNNIDKCHEANRTHYANNTESRKKSHKDWVDANPGKANAHHIKRKAAKLKRTPPWLSETQLLEIENFYKISQWYDEPMHVDHIVPLQGDLVSGLHVPWNLQILTASANTAKGNRYSI